MDRYNPKHIETKWQQAWAKDNLYKAIDFDERPKFVMLTEFPYLSGTGLHMGHAREYTYGDIISRHKRMAGYNVLYPMGYDTFGLPTENYAIKNKIAPQVVAERNITAFQKQFDALGYSVDWDRSFSTADPEYYKWTQWIFLQFYKAGLAYQDDIAINWCPKCKTGLANEEVVNGQHERCDTAVEKKQLKQWVLKITDYADKLIEGLATVDYPSKIADQQINWIGKSVGAEIDFALAPSSIIHRPSSITVFTTRPDTLFGATYMVLAPEHPLVAKITTAENKKVVDEYVCKSVAKTDIERQADAKEKTGVFTGAYAINPATQKKIPIWIADYVLMGYGTGAIMAVPAHDERDFAFAKKFNLPIIQVIMPCESDPNNPPRDDMEMVERDTVIVHLKDKSTGKYALLDWHETLEGVSTAIMGGIESGQSPEEAALTEIKEEAALENIKIVNKLQWITSALYCASHKNQNRKAIATSLLAEVENLNSQGEIDQKELKNHTLVWVDEKDVLDHLTPVHQKLVWQLLNNEAALTGEGELINSGDYNGLDSSVAREKIVADLAKKGVAREKVQYKLRDWIFSRQHYWGEPIPIIHCQKCGTVPVPAEQLPVTLPEVEHYEPTDTGESPLAAIDSWVNVKCPKCGGSAKRETDTMPNWAGSSWYYLRYYDAKNDKEFAAQDKLKYWGQADLYLGGMEHTTLHLLYSRFWHKFLYDQRLVPTEEPYKARRGQGIILAEDGNKMSKSKGNVVDPIEIIDQGYGADALRLAISFIAPYDQTTSWKPESVPGTYRFLNRVWTLTKEYKAVSKHESSEKDGEILTLIHQCIYKVSHDLENLNFNTAISALMETTNGLYLIKEQDKFNSRAWEFALVTLAKLIAPFAPHIAEELWQQLGQKGSVHVSEWPIHDEAYLVKHTVNIAIQVNGKVRGEIEMPFDSEQSAVEAAAKLHENASQYLSGDIKKVFYVPNKLISFVV